MGGLPGGCRSSTELYLRNGLGIPTAGQLILALFPGTCGSGAETLAIQNCRGLQCRADEDQLHCCWSETPMSSAGSVSHWIGLLKTGDPIAAQKLWEGYFERLVRLARSRLRDLPRRAADEEDVALSAFDSFCRGAEC